MVDVKACSRFLKRCDGKQVSLQRLAFRLITQTATEKIIDNDDDSADDANCSDDGEEEEEDSDDNTGDYDDGD